MLNVAPTHMPSLVTHYPSHICTIIHYTHNQARNQLGTPGGAKSFLRGGQIFSTMSNCFKLCPAHFYRGEKMGFAPLRRPLVTGLQITQIQTMHSKSSHSTAP